MTVCPFCRQPGPLGVYDEAVGAYAHESCSLTATWSQVAEARDFAAAHPEEVER